MPVRAFGTTGLWGQGHNQMSTLDTHARPVRSISGTRRHPESPLMSKRFSRLANMGPRHAVFA
jgi:hypothetical protein